jgi:hypothetical protein
MQLTHSVKGACFQPLNLSSDFLVSKFAFKCNVNRYTSTAKGKSSGTQAPSWRSSSRRRQGWLFSRYSVQNSGYGLALFTIFGPELGLWVGTFHHVIVVCQNTNMSSIP